MKLISTFLLFFLFVLINASGKGIDSLPSAPRCIVPASQPLAEKQAAPNNTSIRLRCSGGFRHQPEPLLVIDGVVAEYTEFQNLNPADIVSIEILKDASATAIYGNSPARGVIIITTKSALATKLIIKDFLAGEPVPGATLFFFSKTDTIKTVADDRGVLVTYKLKKGLQYDVLASSAGYKKFSTIAKGKEQVILLEKDIKECAEVFVKASTPIWICKRMEYSNEIVTKCSMGGGRVEDSRTKDTGKLFRDKTAAVFLYPNPVQRNHSFHLQLESDSDQILQLSVTGINGKLVLLQSQKMTKGLNRFSITADTKWAAGIYIIQLRNDKGEVIKNEKLVIQ